MATNASKAAAVGGASAQVVVADKLASQTVYHSIAVLTFADGPDEESLHAFVLQRSVLGIYGNPVGNQAELDSYFTIPEGSTVSAHEVHTTVEVIEILAKDFRNVSGPFMPRGAISHAAPPGMPVTTFLDNICTIASNLNPSAKPCSFETVSYRNYHAANQNCHNFTWDVLMALVGGSELNPVEPAHTHNGESYRHYLYNTATIRTDAAMRARVTEQARRAVSVQAEPAAQTEAEEGAAVAGFEELNFSNFAQRTEQLLPWMRHTGATIVSVGTRFAAG